MKSLIVLLACSAVLTLAGCQTEKPSQPPAPASAPVSAPAPAATAPNLAGTQWKLQTIAGKAVIANSRATLMFPEAGRAAGNSSCNRFAGAVTIAGDAIKFGPLAGTRMLCDDPANQQETAYLKALDAVQKFAVTDGKLLLFAGSAEPALTYRAATADEAK
ncbi:MAG TPA: META domain-containing protein [Dongiaceae bacterium]|nr:META domain-containing protein [Dongiaceae bacterium]